MGTYSARGYLRRVCFYSTVALLLAYGALADEPDHHSSPNTIFYSVSDLTRALDATATIIGGEPADPEQWPATFYTFSCSASLVAARAILLAAHCLNEATTISISRNGTLYEGSCSRPPEYPSNRSADWALCLMQSEIPNSTPYETLNIDPTKVVKFEDVLLTGFGCQQPSRPGSSTGKIFATGPARVVSLPYGSNNFIVTSGSVAVCFGDSGGGAYINASTERVTNRRLVSLNAIAEWDIHLRNFSGTSYLASVSTADGLAFIRAWSDKYDMGICGVHPDTRNCR